MTEPSAGWHPDPFNRFAQRYWDGTQWTSEVADTAGAQSTDPPVQGVGPSPGPMKTSSLVAFNDVPRAALVVAGVGIVLVLLSFFALTWYTVSAETKSEVNSAFSDPDVEATSGLSAADINDGLSWSEIRTVESDADQGGGSSDISWLSDQYVQWGWYLALLAAAACAAALFFAPARRYAIGAAVVMALWHAYVVYDGSGSGSSTAIGAWLGAVGLIVVGAATLVVTRLPQKPAGNVQL